MEAASVLKSALCVQNTPLCTVKSRILSSCPAKLGLNNGLLKCPQSTSLFPQARRIPTARQRRNPFITASSLDSSEPSNPVAPLRFESPVGQFLSQILISHPHLLPAAVDQQLQQLQNDRDAEMTKEEPSTAGTDLVLYRRIAEVKENERKKALEEILYTLVVEKFVTAEVPLIHTLSQSSDSSGKVDTWPDQMENFQKLHSPDAYEMIRNHLTLILGNRLGDSNTIAQISKLRVGQVYAASIIYGYFLKRVDQRFQLEKNMKILPSSDEKNSSTQEPVSGENSSSWYSGFSPAVSHPGIKPSRLRSYVMSFDPETMQKYATIRSKEAINIIEKHTESLFGRAEISITSEGRIDSSKDENMKISFSGLTRLVLEAVTVGSFLWDVESFVDARYSFVTN